MCRRRVITAAGKQLEDGSGGFFESASQREIKYARMRGGFLTPLIVRFTPSFGGMLNCSEHTKTPAKELVEVLDQ